VGPMIATLLEAVCEVHGLNLDKCILQFCLNNGDTLNLLPFNTIFSWEKKHVTWQVWVSLKPLLKVKSWHNSPSAAHAAGKYKFSSNLVQI